MWAQLRCYPTLLTSSLGSVTSGMWYTLEKRICLTHSLQWKTVGVSHGHPSFNAILPPPILLSCSSKVWCWKKSSKLRIGVVLNSSPCGGEYIPIYAEHPALYLKNPAMETPPGVQCPLLVFPVKERPGPVWAGPEDSHKNHQGTGTLLWEKAKKTVGVSFLWEEKGSDRTYGGLSKVKGGI